MSAAMIKAESKVPERSSVVKATRRQAAVISTPSAKSTVVKSKDNKPNGDAPNIEKVSGKQRVQNVPVKVKLEAKSPTKAAKKSSGEPKAVYKNTGVPFMQRLFTEGLERNEYTNLAAIQGNAAISAKICVRGPAFFICENERCQTRCWSSNRAWITIDLARPGVLRRYKQRCAGCGQSSWPRVFKNALEEFVDHVVDIYLSRADLVRHPSSSTKNAPVRNRGGNNKSHLKELCEKCGYGKRDCSVGTSYRF